MQSCEDFLATPPVGGSGGICVFDPKTLALVAWIVFPIDTAAFCEDGVPGFTLTVECLDQWADEEDGCPSQTIPSPTYCNDRDGGFVFAVPTDDAASDGARE